MRLTIKSMHFAYCDFNNNLHGRFQGHWAIGYKRESNYRCAYHHKYLSARYLWKTISTVTLKSYIFNEAVSSSGGTQIHVVYKRS